MRIHALQYLRALAALAVVYSHSVIQVDTFEKLLPHRGSFGVDVFFVISGFIMVYISRPGDTPGSFMLNRVRRVVPLYWFFILLMALILLVAPGVFKTTVFDVQILLKSLAFIPHYSLAHPDELWPLVAPGWSLNYEMYFYLCFAVSLWLAPRYRLAFISALILAVFLVARLSGVHAPGSWQQALASFYGDAIVFEFVFGMLIAWLWLRGIRLPARLALPCLLVAAALLVFPPEAYLPRLWQFGLPSALIVMATISLPLPAVGPLILLGDASYALYLSHIFTLGIVRKIIPPFLGTDAVAAWQFVLISLVACTLVSIVVHRLVDNWFLRVDRLNSFRSRRGVKPSRQW